MTDDVDEILRRLFVDTPIPSGADELFVARVAGRISRRRLFHAAARICGAAVLLAVTTILSPILTVGSAYVAETPILLTEHLVASPIGGIASMAVGVFFLIRVVVRQPA